jgi:hypothetical protein
LLALNSIFDTKVLYFPPQSETVFVHNISVWRVVSSLLTLPWAFVVVRISVFDSNNTINEWCVQEIHVYTTTHSNSVFVETHDLTERLSSKSCKNFCHPWAAVDNKMRSEWIYTSERLPNLDVIFPKNISMWPWCKLSATNCVLWCRVLPRSCGFMCCHQLLKGFSIRLCVSKKYMRKLNV